MVLGRPGYTALGITDICTSKSDNGHHYYNYNIAYSHYLGTQDFVEAARNKVFAYNKRQ